MTFKFNPLIGIGLDDIGTSGGGGGGAAIDFQEFTSNGTWTKPENVTWVEVEIIGGGGGGGSGYKTTAFYPGGTGGWGSPITRKLFAASGIGSTENITIGAGGTGGASVTTNSTVGNDGTDGGTSSFGSHLTSGFGTKGKGANAGNVYPYHNVNPACAPSERVDVFSSNPGGGTVVNSNAPRPLSYGMSLGTNWCGGGGGGGGTYSTNLSPAGPGGWQLQDATFTNNAGALDGDNGGSIASGGLSGGGGGAGSLVGNAGNGGNASIGGGGGGGGAALNDVGDSGAGGNGGNGRVRIWAW